MSGKEIPIPHMATPQGHVVTGPATNQQEGTVPPILKWLIDFIVPGLLSPPQPPFLTSQGLC